MKIKKQLSPYGNQNISRNPLDILLKLVLKSGNKFPKLKNLKNIRIYKPVIRKNIKGKRISIFRAKVDIPSVITYADRVIIVIVITQWGVWGITIVVTNPFILVCIRQSSKIEYNK